MELNTFLITSTGGGLEQLVGGVVIYVYLAFTLMILARRLAAPHMWMAWVPIANMYLMTKMANLPWWWVLGFFIPFINFFIAGYVWSEIGKKFGKPWWVGGFVCLPLIGLIVPGYLVFTTGSFVAPAPKSQESGAPEQGI